MQPRTTVIVALAALALGCMPAGSATPSPSSSASPSAPGGNPAAVVEGATYAPSIDTAAFSTTIDNPFLPLVPGTTHVFEGDGERVEVVVTHETREVMGVTAVVVLDRAFADGELVEETRDWYAQDGHGNVWYFGEETAEYEGGKVTSTAGSWEAGVDGAQPGIVMLADPRPGDTYRQEFYEGEAEDMAKVLELGRSVDVPFGTFTDTLTTEDWTPLEPDLLEHKTYARGVGVVIEEGIRGGGGTLELVEVTSPG